jgi:hypothetical protein
MQNISDKCNEKCEYFEIGIYGTKFCTWCCDKCPEEGCYKEKREKEIAEGGGEFFFYL